ncbi:MAG: MogA/MoaB family molybdenum cofactor biosynthesis protein [Thermodesulfovibrionales bacterium]|nr:MogA/MoaB family molybdenum cofactor biosynthesis protein [Thermodesulfovibrionales bacterium]
MIRIGILTMSDRASKGERIDESGQVIRDMVKDMGEVLLYEIIPDEKEIIKKKLMEFSERVDLVLTTGGTGLSPRDVTPEATIEVIEREIPGISEAMRYEGLKKTPMAMLSRAVAGVRGNCLIINLPGNPRAVKENLEVILSVIPHAIEKIKGDTSECASLTKG